VTLLSLARHGVPGQRLFYGMDPHVDASRLRFSVHRHVHGLCTRHVRSVPYERYASRLTPDPQQDGQRMYARMTVMRPAPDPLARRGPAQRSPPFFHNIANFRARPSRGRRFPSRTRIRRRPFTGTWFVGLCCSVSHGHGPPTLRGPINSGRSTERSPSP